VEYEIVGDSVGRDPLAPPFPCFDLIVFHLMFAIVLPWHSWHSWESAWATSIGTSSRWRGIEKTRWVYSNLPFSFKPRTEGLCLLGVHVTTSRFISSLPFQTPHISALIPAIKRHCFLRFFIRFPQIRRRQIPMKILNLLTTSTSALALLAHSMSHPQPRFGPAGQCSCGYNWDCGFEKYCCHDGEIR
jgi:hypothetical protein